MFKFLARLFRRNVDDVIADMQARVDLLAEISREQQEDARFFETEAQVLLRKSATAHSEAVRATVIRQKIQALIS